MDQHLYNADIIDLSPPCCSNHSLKLLQYPQWEGYLQITRQLSGFVSLMKWKPILSALANQKTLQSKICWIICKFCIQHSTPILKELVIKPVLKEQLLQGLYRDTAVFYPEPDEKHKISPNTTAAAKFLAQQLRLLSPNNVMNKTVYHLKIFWDFRPDI